MYLSLGELLALFAFGGACVYFLSAIRIRELALQAVQRASRNGDFQLLDQSVHILSLIHISEPTRLLRRSRIPSSA